MRAVSHPHLIDIDELRVGMYVHLDTGWMSHPFPLSHFKIGSAQQIETLRTLGLQQIRWSPEQSDIVAPDLPAHAAPVVLPVSARALPVSAAPPARPAATPAASRDASRRLREQRAALRACERQFAAAAQSCKQLNDLAVTRPRQAHAQAEALSVELADQLLGQHDTCIRLLTESAGDRLSHHALNVAVISLLLARTFGFSDAEMIDLGIGALLHDMGKLALPLRLRFPEDSFTPAERRGYEEHVAHGVAMARRMELSGAATLVVAQHHEHADGSGFPLKLGTDRMTLAARIVALVDRYDNLCNPYFLARALTPHEALSLLFAQCASKYDTSILSGFIRMMGVYPPGSTVQLTDDRYALVTSVSSNRSRKPTVLIHDPSVPRDAALTVDLETAGDLGIRRSIKALQLPDEAFAYLAPRQRVAYFFEPAQAEPATAPAG